jgi:hypothetical protein
MMLVGCALAYLDELKVWGLPGISPSREDKLCGDSAEQMAKEKRCISITKYL